MSFVPAAAGLFLPRLYPFIPSQLSSAIGYSSKPGAVIHVDGDEEEDSFDHVERDIGAGEA
jgi:hypothetical protein